MDTNFAPGINSFRFDNSFDNAMFHGRLSTAGRCGGMVYAALDYYYNGVPIPQDTDLPPDGTPLSDYIFNRNIDGLRDMVPLFAAVMALPRGQEYDQAVRDGGQISLLMSFIDRGIPVPLGLVSTGAKLGYHHQVLGIGYDQDSSSKAQSHSFFPKVMRMPSDPVPIPIPYPILPASGPANENVTIRLYDPNYHQKTILLQPDPASKTFVEFRPDETKVWQTFFVSPRFFAHNPPPANSLLPAPPAPGQSLVPWCVGFKLSEARNMLTNVNLAVGTLSNFRSGRDVRGNDYDDRVASQSRAPGSAQDPGTRIDLDAHVRLDPNWYH